MNDLNWDNDWHGFIQKLEAELAHDATATQANKSMAGTTVRWHGIIESSDIDDLSATVNIELPKVFLPLPSGDTIELDGVTVSVAESDEKLWAPYKPNSQVYFQARLGQTGSPFPAIRLKRFSDGKHILLLNLSNAIPLSP